MIRLAQAKIRFKEFNGQVKAFSEENAYIRVVEPDLDIPKKLLHKVKQTKPLPVSMEAVAAEIAEHLRSVLDGSMYAIAGACKVPNPRDCVFPISDTPTCYAKLASIGYSPPLEPSLALSLAGSPVHPYGIALNKR